LLFLAFLTHAFDRKIHLRGFCFLSEEEMEECSGDARLLGIRLCETYHAEIALGEEKLEYRPSDKGEGEAEGEGEGEADDMFIRTMWLYVLDEDFRGQA
jgi:hypothetical protein